MISVYSVDHVRAAEEELFAQVPDGTLMQRAASGLATACAGLLSSVRGSVVGSRVVLLVGSGNNGGDALWAGAFLRDRGCRVDAVALSERLHAEGAAALTRAGGRTHAATDTTVPVLLAEADLVLDGILGIGGRGALREPAASVVQLALHSDACIVAVDLPSGVDADTGAVAGDVVKADLTVTFGCLKPGLLVGPGRDCAGAIRLVDIGLGESLAHRGEPVAMVLDGIDVARWVREPSADAYKYSRGVIGIAAGSGQYPGAALLCTSAARHANTGMVRYLDRSDGNARMVVEHFPDIVIDGAAPADQVRASAWACGPGFVGEASDEPTVLAVLAAKVPVVLDAGALQVVADSAHVRERLQGRHGQGLPTIVTPHEGEFRRIAPGVLEASDGRIAAARTAASQLGAIVVLKGAGTVMSTPEGAVRIDREGTSDLGVAGSGDILTGIIGAVVADAWQAGAQSALELLDAVAAGVWLHGMAGRIAAKSGPVTATDIGASVRAAVQVARFGETADPA